MGLCQSMVSKGFKPEETVTARDAKADFASLRCGDGMKRVLSAKLVFLVSQLVVCSAGLLFHCLINSV